MDVDLGACIEGEKEAWDAFVLRWSSLIFAAVHRTLARSAGRLDEGLVEDIVQDVFVRLVKDDCRLLRTYDPGRASLSTWLTIVARSVALDRVRRRPPMPTLDLTTSDFAHPSEELSDPTPDAPAVPLHLLTARQRLVLRLLFDEGRSVEETARFLDVNAQTVRSTKHKALERLRAHLSPQRAEPGDER